MNEQAQKFRIGVFVLAALLLLAVLITLFGSFPRVLTRANEYTVRFTEAPGIGPGTPVRRSGVRVGEVKSVDLDDETGNVLVRILIEKRYTIRRNEVPTIVQGIFGGDTFVDFVPRREDGEPPDRSPVEPGAEVTGTRQATVSTLLNQASEVVPTTQEALNDIRKSVQRFERMAPVVEDAAKEFRDLAKATRESIPDLRKTNEEVQKAATEIGKLAKATSDNVPELNKTNEEVRKAAAEVNALAKELRQALPDVRKSSEEVRTAATEIGKLARGANETLPELRKTNTEAQVALRTWDKLGERLRLTVENNEERVTKLLENLNAAVEGARDIVKEENRTNLSALLKNLREGTRDLDKLRRNADEGLTEARGTMARADRVLDNLQSATKPLADRSESVMKNLDEGLARLNGVLGDAQALFRAIDKGDGTLRRFITDPSLYNHIDEAACLVTKLLPRLERVLRDVEVFADKIARHPESLGIGGAVRPSSGLKESPTIPVVPSWKPSGR
jgi:ABC-type transporter Mla subunit MlaD